jgi:hypothetical protein
MATVLQAIAYDGRRIAQVPYADYETDEDLADDADLFISYLPQDSQFLTYGWQLVDQRTGEVLTAGVLHWTGTIQ